MESLLSGVSFDYDLDTVNADSGATVAKSRLKNGLNSKNAAVNSESITLRPGSGACIESGVSSSFKREEDDESK